MSHLCTKHDLIYDELCWLCLREQIEEIRSEVQAELERIGSSGGAAGFAQRIQAIVQADNAS